MSRVVAASFPLPMRTSRKVLVVIAVLLVVLLWSSRGLANAYTDWLWYEEIGQRSVWTTTLWTKLGLAFGFGLVVLGLVWGNMFLAERRTIDLSALRPEEEIVERYQELMGPFRPMLRLAFSFAFAVIAGTRATRQWQNWLLFRRGGSFDRVDPVFGNDAGFYVFRLPFLSFVIGWLFAILLFVLVLVVLLYYLNGQIRLSRSASTSPEAKLHISVLLAVVALTRSAKYWVDRYELLHLDRRRFTGALATDVNLLIPGFYLLTLISILGAALLLWNIRREGWGLPLIVLGLWLLSHILIVGLLPAFYQSFRVDPQEIQQESEFVDRNISATRFAYGLDESRLSTETFDHADGLTAEDIAGYSDVLDNVPILDPQLASDSFSVLQGEGAFYKFSESLDVDRYMIDGEARPVVLSARGLELSQVDPNWERQRISFTHGYGMAIASGFEVENDRPVLLIDDLAEQVPVDDRLDETFDQPRIYFGEDFGGYSIVGAKADEIDFKSQNDSETNRYDGTGGVDVSSFARQAAFAIRFNEIDPLISQNVEDGSRVILNRDIGTRVRELAPFLRWDSDPHPVLADGEIYWMIDGYTTSNRFPYSQQVNTTLTNSELAGNLNYVRSSVKAVINAYTGETTLYLMDDEDPIIQTWADTYPDLFTDSSAMPGSLQDHLRYPRESFTVQSDMWARYHVSEVEAFIQDVITWSVARQPARAASSDTEDVATQAGAMQAQYLMAKLPGSDAAEFVLQRGFVPRQGEGTTSARPKMQGLMVAQSDPENYGKLISYEVTGSQPNAPELVHSDIQKVDGISDYVSLRSIQGSDVKWGPMSIVMVDDTFVFVRPVYVLGDGQQSLPELRNVIAVNGDRIAMRPTLDAALTAVATGAPATVEDVELDDSQASPEEADEPEPDEPVEPEEQPDQPAEPSTPVEPADPGSYDPSGKSIVELLADADRLLVEADAAEAAGDADLAARRRQESKAAISEASRLLQGQ